MLPLSVINYMQAGPQVGTMTRLRAGQSGVRIPVRVRDFFLLQILPTTSGAHPVSYSMGIGFISRR